MSDPKSSGNERLAFIFSFLIIFGIIMMLTRENPTRAQQIFRAAIVSTGTLGLLWLQLRRK